MARSWLRGKVPDLILLDAELVDLPNGGDLCQELRADGAPTQNVPLILLTEGEEQRQQGLQHDVSDYLAKPFIPEEVVRRVATLVSLHISELAGGSYRDELEIVSEALQNKNRMLEGLSSKLSKYLPPQVYQSIFTGTHDATLATERKRLTVFFSDIKDFTTATEDLQPEALTQILNTYFTEMSKIALEYGATIDKFIGDAMLIFFGDPQSRGVKEDAQACLRMAIDMQRRLAELGERWRMEGYEHPFEMRVGINTGYCNVGNFGSDERMDYTIIGGEVNLAARLESRAEPGGILISYETFALVRDIIRAEALDPIQVKGIRRDICPYAVRGLADEFDRSLQVFHKEQHGLTLSLDLEKINDASRPAIIEDLEQALDMARKRPE